MNKFYNFLSKHPKFANQYIDLGDKLSLILNNHLSEVKRHLEKFSNVDKQILKSLYENLPLEKHRVNSTAKNSHYKKSFTPPSAERPVIQGLNHNKTEHIPGQFRSDSSICDNVTEVIKNVATNELVVQNLNNDFSQKGLFRRIESSVEPTDYLTTNQRWWVMDSFKSVVENSNYYIDTNKTNVKFAILNVKSPSKSIPFKKITLELDDRFLENPLKESNDIGEGTVCTNHQDLIISETKDQ